MVEEEVDTGEPGIRGQQRGKVCPRVEGLSLKAMDEDDRFPLGIRRPLRSRPFAECVAERFGQVMALVQVEE